MKSQWHNELVEELKRNKTKSEMTQKSLLEISSIILQIVEEHYLIRKSIDRHEKRYMISQDDLVNIISTDDRFKNLVSLKSQYTVKCLKYDIEHSVYKLYNYTEERYNKKSDNSIVITVIAVLLILLFVILLFHFI